jgi:hypothetical protein
VINLLELDNVGLFQDFHGEILSSFLIPRESDSAERTYEFIRIFTLPVPKVVESS